MAAQQQLHGSFDRRKPARLRPEKHPSALTDNSFITIARPAWQKTDRPSVNIYSASLQLKRAHASCETCMSDDAVSHTLLNNTVWNSLVKHLFHLFELRERDEGKDK